MSGVFFYVWRLHKVWDVRPRVVNYFFLAVITDTVQGKLTVILRVGRFYYLGMAAPIRLAYA